MRPFIFIPWLIVAGLVVSVPDSTGLSYTVSLQTPKIESVQTSLRPTGGAVNVELAPSVVTECSLDS
jgi:hypothetical protein